MSLPRTIPQLSALTLTLRLAPPPRNISESREVLKALQKFGQVTAFKALRFPSSFPNFTPTAHVVFASADAVTTIRSLSPLRVDVGGATTTGNSTIQAHVVDDYGKWGGREHEEYILRASGVVTEEDGGWQRMSAVRASGTGYGIRPGRRMEFSGFGDRDDVDSSQGQQNSNKKRDRKGNGRPHT